MRSQLVFVIKLAWLGMITFFFLRLKKDFASLKGFGLTCIIVLAILMQLAAAASNFWQESQTVEEVRDGEKVLVDKSSGELLEMPTKAVSFSLYALIVSFLFYFPFIFSVISFWLWKRICKIKGVEQGG